MYVEGSEQPREWPCPIDVCSSSRALNSVLSGSDRRSNQVLLPAARHVRTPSSRKIGHSCTSKSVDAMSNITNQLNQTIVGYCLPTIIDTSHSTPSFVKRKHGQLMHLSCNVQIVAIRQRRSPVPWYLDGRKFTIDRLERYLGTRAQTQRLHCWFAAISKQPNPVHGNKYIYQTSKCSGATHFRLCTTLGFTHTKSFCLGTPHSIACTMRPKSSVLASPVSYPIRLKPKHYGQYQPTSWWWHSWRKSKANWQHALLAQVRLKLILCCEGRGDKRIQTKCCV